MPTPVTEESESQTQGAAAFFRSATLTVVTAFCLRALLLFLSRYAEDKYHLGLQVIGQEAGAIAWSLASGNGFSHPFQGYDLPTGWLAPVFPALWSIGFWLFDPNLSDRGVYFGQLMNCAFSAFTCWPIHWLGRRLFSARVGLAAAWVWVFMPLAILFPLEWVWDQSLSALALALLLCVTYQLRNLPADSLAWSGYGLLWGFAALLNPTLCVMLPFLLGWLAVRRRAERHAVLYPAFKAVLLFLLCILPWTARNYFVLDGFVFVKSNFGLELWLGNNPQVPSDDVYAPQLHPMNNFKELLPLVFSGEPGYMRARQRAALRFMREHPRTWLQLVARRVLDTWTASNDSRHDKWMAALHLGRAEIAFCTAFSVLAILGCILALGSGWAERLPLVFCVAIFPVPYYLTHTTLRYRHPIDPVLTLLAVWAVARVMAPASFRARDGLPRPAAATTPAR